MGVGALVGSALIGGGLSYLGAKKSASATKDAAKTSAAATLAAQRDSQKYQEKMLREAQGYMSPYTSLGTPEMIDAYKNFSTSGAGADILQQMSDLAAGGINMDYESNPAYQWRLAQQEEALQRAQASIGGLRSSDTYGLLGDMTMQLSGEEADKQYLRGVDDYNRNLADLVNQYNYRYGNLTDTINLGYNANAALGNMATGVGSNVGNQIMQGGLSSAANTMAANTAAANQMQQGYAGLGSGISSALNTYSVAPALESILNDMTQQKQANPYASGLGWGVPGRVNYMSPSNPYGLTPGQGL